jgi:heat shock protein HslJ
MRRFAILGLMVGLFLACDETAPTAPSRPDLLDRTWRLQSIRRVDGTTVAVPMPDRFTMEFTPNGRLNMRADCNTCSGTYQLNGTELSTGALACTRAFCGSDSLDTEFLRVFQSSATMVAADGALFVSRANTQLTFRP